MRTPLSCVAIFVTAGCVASPGDCFAVPAATAALRGGGWDLNGTSLGGGWDHNGASLRGGWDRKSPLAGAERDGVVLVDPRSLAPIEIARGRLEGGAAGTLELSAVTPSGAVVPLTARLARTEGEVPLYEVTVDGSPICDGLAMFSPGRWSSTGAYEATHGSVTIACERGAITKCALWGYAPWTVGTALHTACTRMVRADYCGDGSAWTRDGTLIDVTDPEGIQELAGGEGMRFEAGWSEDGAVCVSAARYEVVGAAGESILPPCWERLPRCGDPAHALELGALVLNYTLHESIPACQ